MELFVPVGVVAICLLGCLFGCCCCYCRFVLFCEKRVLKCSGNRRKDKPEAVIVNSSDLMRPSSESSTQLLTQARNSRTSTSSTYGSMMYDRGAVPSAPPVEESRMNQSYQVV